MKKWTPLATSICLSAVLLAGCGTEEINNLNEPDAMNDSINGSAPNTPDEPTEADPDNNAADENTEPSSGQDQSGLSIGDTAHVQSNVQNFRITLNDVRFVEEYEGSLSEFDDFVIANYTVENLADDVLDAYDAVDIFELDGITDSSMAIDGFEAISGQLQTGETASGEVIYYAYDEPDHQITVQPGIASVGGIDDISWDLTRTSAE